MIVSSTHVPTSRRRGPLAIRGGTRRGAGRRRGQTLVIALSVLFLLVILGSTFVTLVITNLQRVSRQGETDDSLSLALAGLQYAAEQFRASPEGADWRPRNTEALWRRPELTNVPLQQQRQLDPDFEWLSDQGRYQRPFVRVPTGRGRCLLRVTYRPTFRNSSQAAETAGASDAFDPNSGMLVVESVGRPGEFDSNDPTSFRDPADPKVVGPARKVQAYVPLGLVDQLWWITNRTNERGPANLGVAPYRAANVGPGEPGGLVECPTLFQGSIRSNVSLQLNGRNVLRVYPSRNEGLFVRGKLTYAPRGNQDAIAANEPPLRIDILADQGGPNPGQTGSSAIPPDTQNDQPADDTRLLALPVVDSNHPNFASQPYQQLGSSGGAPQRTVFDDVHLRKSAEDSARSMRFLEAPPMDQPDPVTGAGRYVVLTRDSGGSVLVREPNSGQTRIVNTGWFGLTDQSLPPQLRARGLYLDNFSDVQYPSERRRVKNEWLQRGSERTGWYGDYYVPAVRDTVGGQLRGIAEILLTRILDSNTGQLKPVIRITRSDPDLRQLNLPGGPTSDPRHFYSLANVSNNAGGATADIGAPMQVKDFDFPVNGVLFAEGSVRVRGTVGFPGNPKQLTIVSGGTIYVEGNLLKGDGASHLALLAQDFVALNPTAFTRVEAGSDVTVEPHAWQPETALPRRWHFSIPQDRSIDFVVSSARPLARALLMLEHSAVEGGSSGETAITLSRPILAARPQPWPDWTTDRFNFALAPFGPAGIPQPFYLFHSIPGTNPVTWAESAFTSRQGQPGNFEGKTFLMPGPAVGDAPLPAGMEGRFRLTVGPKDDPASGQPIPTVGGQPYWLSRVAVVPADGPLPIKIEAVMYAFNGSWFVIPPPFFNGRDDDTRFRYLTSAVRHYATAPTTGLNPDPAGTDNPAIYPFFNEPLNVDIQVVGSITENMPAEPSEAALWTSRLWVSNLDFDATNGNPDNDPSRWPAVDPDNPAQWIPGGRSLYSPRLTYRFDATLRRMIRVRFLRPYTAVNFRQEEVAWVAPGPVPPGVSARPLQQILSEAIAADSYVELLPMLPRLPVGQLVYEGNPL